MLLMVIGDSAPALGTCDRERARAIEGTYYYGWPIILISAEGIFISPGGYD